MMQTFEQVLNKKKIKELKEEYNKTYTRTPQERLKRYYLSIKIDALGGDV